MTSKLKIAAAGAVLAVLVAVPAFAQPPPGTNPVQVRSGTSNLVEQAKLCKPRRYSVTRCIRGQQKTCRYRVTLFCRRILLGCRVSGPPCFVPY